MKGMLTAPAKRLLPAIATAIRVVEPVTRSAGTGWSIQRSWVDRRARDRDYSITP